MNKIIAFKELIWDYYRHNRRDFVWRNTSNPYYILVSEIMLQQTQTHRVIHKYEEFIVTFPTLETLAASTLRDVLIVWHGLGYYRRARYLHQLAQIVVGEYAGVLPQDTKMLQTLPGIGAGTAGSIGAFAFNIPTVFIETNIRAVFIHCFFDNKKEVSDKELLPLIAATVDHDNPREWYYALMDYGVWCKSMYVNPSRKSIHYIKQSPFEGSNRQIRAQILKLIAQEERIAHQDIVNAVNKAELVCIEEIIKQLLDEKFIQKDINDVYSIT